MHSLAQIMAERIATGLRRKSISTCSKWAEAYRILGGKDFPGAWKFKYHPWLREMHDSNAQLNVGQKAAQVGYTETVLNRTFYKIDIERVDCLYVLPAKTPDASDFSAARFDPALELSEHLSKLFSDVKNIGHKRAGTTNLYIRGSKSRSGLKSVPVGFLVLDEVDEMDADNIPLAMERQAGQLHREAWAISTPTIENKGINALYQTTTQEHFFFTCPCCSRMTELLFPDCLEITATELNDPRIAESRYLCKECKGTLPHETKWEWLETAKWVPSFSDREERGFHVSQLYSSAMAGRPTEMAKSYLRAQTNPADEQEFYNSKLGLAHTVDGAKLNDAIIKECMASHKRGPTRNNLPRTMGVDVGRWLHYEIDEWKIPEYVTSDLSIQSRPRVINIGKCSTFDELDLLMHEYNINFCVIDANPERRKAFEFASRFWGYVKMCFYGRGIQGKQIQVPREDTGEPAITVDRTSWIDLALGRFRAKIISLPLDTPEEYKQHLKALVRVYEKDPDGNAIGRYVKGNEEDHYAHSRTYSEIALTFAASMNSSENITDSPV